MTERLKVRDWKSRGRVKPPRGFESHPLRSRAVCDGLERPASKGRDGADCKSGMDVTYDEELVELAVASGSSAFVALDLSTAIAYGVAS